ncbi:RDD family protein [Stenotrophomonas acidaminiphila]|uniref:Transmembrane RDD family protein n=1 Tax=Stenotrophomonas acidaminiphila TaxID=128780 RepID=A0A0S1AUY7_9GAMM|nr:RDD family protein [Stenotrophomonas acidaminiphila]ALJ26613.1 transmembrane RDD family protein [Stenotrophomonas acidaminiphila]WHL19166.1 RDD family protein [Stenotrophomonas acidaminiphila]
MSQWYYADAQRERHGPVEADVLRDKFRRNELDLGSLVWREGMSQWQPLSAMAEELQLLVPAATGAGIDLRADYQAIEDGTAVAKASAAAPSPYAAPASATTGEAVVNGGEIVYAGFWKRVAAYFIDSLIVGIVGGVVAMVIGMVLGIGMAGVGGGSDAMGAGFIAIQLLTNLVSIGLAAAYYAGFHASSGKATLGKMAVGIKVVRSNGERITIARGIGRYFAAMLSGLILCIGYLMAAFTERKQSLHDMICDTLVVDKWAFTDHPEWQQRGLGTVTIVILSLFGVMVLVGLVALLAIIGIAASSFS